VFVSSSDGIVISRFRRIGTSILSCLTLRQVDNHPYLWHDFNRWINSSTFEFEAGLSGSRFQFQYDVLQQKTLAEDKRDFQVENNKGLFKIN